jgi:TolB protein
MSRLFLLMASALLVFGIATQLGARPTAETVGIFEGHGDVGTVLQPGSVIYDAAKQSYTLAGSGENMWSTADAFQFVWKKVSGDVSIAADVNFLGQGKNPHRKAVVMVRQTLDADSAYADVALHGEGLTSLQFRDEKGATTHEIQSNISAPRRIQLEKHGDYVYMLLGKGGDPTQVAGGSIRVPIHGDYYVGIGVCSHEKDLIEKAVFTNVQLQAPLVVSGQPVLYSALETVPIESTDRRVVYFAAGRFEAPNWMPDGASLLFNRNGHIEKIAVTGGTPETIDTDFANRCNNDHGISPDGHLLAISDSSQEEHRSLVYVLPITGGTPKRLTRYSPSYWHGWSPDGKTLAFVGERNGNFDIYAISVSGGEEKRLTTAPGLDDGPDYTPDGKYIYFNSERTGQMQIWRMRTDGSDQEQITSDDHNNWFPHISPDGKWMVFLSYDLSVKGHPEDKDVMLRLMSLSDKKITVLAKLFGGQGTINVPSWSPDSKRLAFVSYQWLAH